MFLKTLKWSGIVVLVLLALSSLVMFKVNRIEREARKEAEKRLNDYRAFQMMQDKLLKENGIILDSLAVVNAVLTEEYLQIKGIKDEATKITIPNYIDVMSYSDQQKRDTMSRLVKDIHIRARQLREVQDELAKKQGHNKGVPGDSD